jgi:hypothetical protein
MKSTTLQLVELFAYIDPGTGSMLLQMLVAGLLGVVMVMRRFRERLFGLFTRKRDDTPRAGAEASSAQVRSAHTVDPLADEASKS